MFSLGIRYLNGWAMAAADGTRKERAEWPPHPDRVFMALAAAWFETGQDPAEGEALRWLEGLEKAPAIAASEAEHRQTSHDPHPPVHFVPVNDTSTPFEDEKKGKLAMPTGDLPLGKPRRERTFPVAIPHLDVVHLIWQEPVPDKHREGLAGLCRKVVSVGHSASLVQMWLEDTPPEPSLVPLSGLASYRLRRFGPGRLDYLEQRQNRTLWVEYHDRDSAIKGLKEAARNKEPDLYAPVCPKRAAWNAFPEALLLATESAVKRHPVYAAAKAGEAAAAAHLVQELVTPEGLAAIQEFVARYCGGTSPVLVSAHAYEKEGVNAIPAALAELLSERLGLAFDSAIVQSNVVAHTGADGFGRLARQAAFDGPVEPGQTYVLVDDFIGQGGTLANLRGHLIAGSGQVAAAIALTGKPYSAILTPTQEQLHELRTRHKTLETWWRKHFGHPFDHLTQSEARYLARSPDADTIRDRLAAAEQPGDRPGHPGNPRRLSLKKLEAEQSARFPNGPPVSLRPEPGLWQGYGPPITTSEVTPQGSLFDPRLVVLAFSGKRLPLSSTLKLTEALRGALFAHFGEHPIPEWISGHGPGGAASRNPHLALLPLPFVGHSHADGRLMGVALAIPRGIDPDETDQALSPWLRDEYGLPRPIRLFAGQWLECSAELETGPRPPVNLRIETWTAASRRWASVTPVVLDRHFDGSDKWEKAAESVKDGCERIGLPRPLEVLLHPVSLVEGVPRGNEFPWMTRKRDGGRMHHAHALILFEQEVQGPVMVGAGRFRGYGLCRPLMQGENNHA